MRRTSITLPLGAAFVVALLLVDGRQADAQVLTLRFQQGVVTLHAENVSTRDILREWSTIGGATVVNADRLSDAPVSIHLENITETAALATVLRDVSGYVAVRRQDGAGASALERIVIARSGPPIQADIRTVPPPEVRSSSGPTLADIEAMIASRGGVPATEVSPAPASKVAAQRSSAALPGSSSTPQTGAAPSSASSRTFGANPLGAAPGGGRPGEIQPPPAPPGPVVPGSPSESMGKQNGEPVN